MTYDSAEVRAAARKIRRCASRLSESAEPKLSNVRSEVRDSFEGAAANALMNRLEDIDDDIATIRKSLSLLCRALEVYADALDEADRRLAELI